jgi:hypothetical protein
VGGIKLHKDYTLSILKKEEEMANNQLDQKNNF